MMFEKVNSNYNKIMFHPITINIYIKINIIDGLLLV